VASRARIGTDANDGSVARATCAELLSGPITQAAAVKVALLQNGAVRESYERLGIARADLVQAGLVSNPVFSADAKFFSAGPEIELGLAQSFLDLFFIPLRRRVAAADLRAAEASVARDLVSLVYEVRRAFAGALAAEAIVEARRESLRTATTQRDLVRTLYDAGNVPASRRTTLEAGASRAQLDLTESEAMARAAREPLYVLLGLCEASPKVQLVGTLDTLPGQVVDEPVAVSRAVGRSLDLVASCARIESAAQAAGLRRREGVLPLLEVGAVGKGEAEGPWGFGPSVSTALPIFDHGQARALAANAVFRQRVVHHGVLTVEVQSAARMLRDRAAMLRERARSLREEYLPLRSRLVRETVQQYNAMQIGAFEVLSARQQEAEAQLEHLETVRDAWLARLDLEELIAGSLNRERLRSTPHPGDAEETPSAGGHKR
jgi:outer membrane protein, heavy metal efflux system